MVSFLGGIGGGSQCVVCTGGLKARLGTHPQPNHAVEPTPNSLRSCVAPAIGRGSPPALAVMKRGFAPLHEHWSGEEDTRGAIGVEGREAVVP